MYKWKFFSMTWDYGQRNERSWSKDDKFLALVSDDGEQNPKVTAGIFHSLHFARASHKLRPSSQAKYGMEVTIFSRVAFAERFHILASLFLSSWVCLRTQFDGFFMHKRSKKPSHAWTLLINDRHKPSRRRRQQNQSGSNVRRNHHNRLRKQIGESERITRNSN